MKRILAFFFWLLLLGGAYLAYDIHRFLSAPGSEAPEDIVITIAPGATFDRVAWDLKKAGAVTDVARFRLLARYKGVLGRVQAGDYMVSTGWRPEQVLWQITQGQALLYRLSIREGLTWWETAREVEAQGFARAEDFIKVIHDPEFLREHHIPFANAEGFLYPETYLRSKPRALDMAQARDVASDMVTMFWKKTRPLWTQLPRKGDAPAGGVPGAASGGANATLANAPPANGPADATARTGGAALAPGAENATDDSVAAPAPGAENATSGKSVALAPAAGSMGSPDNATQRQAPAAQREMPANATARTAVAPVPPAPSGGTNATPANATLAGGPAGGEAGQSAVPSPAELDPDALYRLVILASLVEKETGIPSERGRVAGVYANRMRLGMLLQCDPTIIYGVGPGFTGGIRKSQLNDAKNRYNTYIHAGLPPGPICSPGLDALKAAAAPERHDFLYFVATGLDGGHSFSKTLNDHNKAVRIYRSRMRDAQ